VADAGERATPEHLVVGHVTKAHGTKGELFVWPLSDRADDVFVPGRELVVGDADGEVADAAPTVRIEAVRPFKRGLLLKLENIDDRSVADGLAQRYLLVPPDAVPPLEEGEVFYHQLLGIGVETVTGEAVGRVREVYETEPHHLLEVEAADGRLHLIPFAARIVTEVDVDGGRIVIDPPDGLLDL